MKKRTQIVLENKWKIIIVNSSDNQKYEIINKSNLIEERLVFCNFRFVKFDKRI